MEITKNTTELQLSLYLIKLNDKVYNNKLFGIEATLLKWKNCIIYAKKTGRIPYFTNPCGLCVQYNSSNQSVMRTKVCDNCPIIIIAEKECIEHIKWSMMCDRVSTSSWIRHAKGFEKWLKETLNKYEKIRMEAIREGRTFGKDNLNIAMCIKEETT